MIAVVCALKNELERFIKRNLKVVNQTSLEKAVFYEGIVNDKDILLIQTGIGKQNARQAIINAIGRFAIDEVISTGFTGALQEGVNVGDIVFVKQALDIESLHETECSVAYSDLINDICKEQEITYHSGKGITVNKAVELAADKKLFGVKYNAIAVDMETSALAEVLAKNHIPLTVFRSVSDDVNSDLRIGGIDKMMDDGNISLKKAGYAVTKNVTIIPGLIKLRKNAIIASSNMSAVMLSILTRSG